MGNKSAATALGSHTDAAAGLASGATSPLIIATKLRAPTYAGDLVRREALLGRLNAARACRLVLLRAPAGYGKTTLAVQWRDALLAEGARVAWLSLDEDDNDPTRFLTYLIEALAGVHAVPGQDLLSALETHSHDVTRFVLGDLVNSVAEFAGDIFLICDDWHAIHEEGVQDALAFLLAHAPANFHLLVASRRQLPLALARLRVEGQVEEVEARDLRFDAAESRQFIQEINALGLPDEDLDRLWRTTDGWVAALQLASLSVRASGDPTAAIAAMTAFGGQRSIGEYLAENVIDKLPAQTLDFLLRTSILDRLCAPQCAAVSGHTDSQTILETLERQDLFIRPLDRERRWFRYHHLFAAYLQRRLERDHPLEVAALHRAACEWFAAEGHTDEAVGHALAAGAQDRAIELVERDSMFLVEHSRMATLLGLVRRLPARRLMDRPKLQMAIAWSHCLTHHPDGVRHALDRLKAALADRAQEPQAPDCNELHAEANLVRGATDIYADCIEGVEALVKPCLDYPDTHRPWVVAVAANVLSYVLIHGFEFDRARALQTWARPFHDRTQGPFSGVYGRCFAGMAAAQQGELDSAGAHFQDALELARGTAGGHSHAARLAGALWGQIQYEYNELALAERLLEESRALGAEGGVADFSLATYIPLTRLRAAAADTAGAHALLDEGVETARELGFERLAAAVDGERVRLYLQEGAIHLAERVVNIPADPRPVGTGIDGLIRESRQLAAARVERAQGNARAAVVRLRRLLADAEGHDRRLAATTLRLPLAQALDDLGQTQAAQAMLIQALEAGARMRLVRSFLDEGLLVLLEQLRDVVRRDAAAMPISEAAIRHLNRLIGTARAADKAAPSAASANLSMHRVGALVEPLKERELQIIRLLGQGCSNKEIARNLGVGVDAVKWHLKNAYAKLCVSRRTQAVAEAKRLGLMD